MARRNRSSHCSATRSGGTPCRAWAIRDSDPPLCSAHAVGNAHHSGARAPQASATGASGGFYSPFLMPTELADLVALAGDESLDDEIALARVCCMRIFQYLNSANSQTTPGTSFATLTATALTGTRTVARLLRERKLISGTAADNLAGSLETILRQVGEHLGVGLMPGDLERIQ